MKTTNSISRICEIGNGQSIMVSKSWTDGEAGYKYQVTFDSPNLIGPVSMPITSEDDLRNFADRFNETVNRLLEDGV